MRTFFIDLENVKNQGFTGIDRLGADDRVFVFYSDGANSLSIPTIQMINRSPASIDYVPLIRSGHNAMDFQIVGLLGFLIGSERQGFYCIVSQDHGYLAAVDFFMDHSADALDVHVLMASNISAAIRKWDQEEAQRKKEQSARNPKKTAAKKTAVRAVIPEEPAEPEFAYDPEVDTIEDEDEAFTEPEVFEQKAVAADDLESKLFEQENPVPAVNEDADADPVSSKEEPAAYIAAESEKAAEPAEAVSKAIADDASEKAVKTDPIPENANKAADETAGEEAKAEDDAEKEMPEASIEPAAAELSAAAEVPAVAAEVSPIAEEVSQAEEVKAENGMSSENAVITLDPIRFSVSKEEVAKELEKELTSGKKAAEAEKKPARVKKTAAKKKETSAEKQADDKQGADKQSASKKSKKAQKEIVIDPKKKPVLLENIHMILNGILDEEKEGQDQIILNALASTEGKNDFYQYFRRTLGREEGGNLYSAIKGSYEKLTRMYEENK